MDEVSYINALIWNMQRPRPEVFVDAEVGYSLVATQVFEHVATVIADPWTARIWFEFCRIHPLRQLTPILACQVGMQSSVDDALARYLASPLPLPTDRHDGVALGRWLDSAGVLPER